LISFTLNLHYTCGAPDASCATGFAGPHAVAAIAGGKNATYYYDANGNMVSGDGRTVRYTAFDKPDELTRSGNTVSFAYGPDRKRYKRIDATLAEGASTTI